MFYWYIKIPMAGWAPGWPPECGTCCVFPTSTMTHGAPGEAADAFLMGGMGYTRDSLKKWIMSTAIPWCSKKILNWPPFSVGFLGFKTCHSLLIYPFSWLRLLEAYCLDPTREGLTFELWVKNCWPKMHSFYQERPVRNDCGSRTPMTWIRLVGFLPFSKRSGLQASLNTASFANQRWVMGFLFQCHR